MQPAPNCEREQKQKETVHLNRAESISIGIKEQMQTNTRKVNVTTMVNLSESTAASSARNKWKNYKKSRKRYHPSPTGIIIEREHVYDIYGEDDDDVAGVPRD